MSTIRVASRRCWSATALRPGKISSRRLFASSAVCRADEVQIIEVGPRDGLQNEKKAMPLELKIDLIRRLAKTGLKTIEAGSFVSPKWVPQMANSKEILKDVLHDPPSAPHDITYHWLLPNKKGLEDFWSVYQGVQPDQDNQMDGRTALNTSSQDPNDSSMSYPTPPPTPPNESMSSPAHEIAIFTAATDSFSKANTNRTVAESLQNFQPLITSAKSRGLRVRAYISVALGCPFEGPNVSPSAVASLATDLLSLGADSLSIADTTGMGTAPRTLQLLKTLREAGVRSEDLALHLHDTFGQALVNAVVGLEHGIRCFDSAVGGLGGCPYSPGATGNVATEDLVHCIHSLGANTGVDLDAVSEIGDWISGELGKNNESRAGKATLAKARRKEQHA